jgi:rubrerythrin
MFIVSIDTIFVILLAVALAIFLFFWSVSKINEWRFHYKPESGHLFRCPICLYMYVNEEERKIMQCPRCKSYSDLNKTKIH